MSSDVLHASEILVERGVKQLDALNQQSISKPIAHRLAVQKLAYQLYHANRGLFYRASLCTKAGVTPEKDAIYMQLLKECAEQVQVLESVMFFAQCWERLKEKAQQENSLDGSGIRESDIEVGVEVLDALFPLTLFRESISTRNFRVESAINSLDAEVIEFCLDDRLSPEELKSKIKAVLFKYSDGRKRDYVQVMDKNKVPDSFRANLPYVRQMFKAYWKQVS